MLLHHETCQKRQNGWANQALRLLNQANMSDKPTRREQMTPVIPVIFSVFPHQAGE